MTSEWASQKAIKLLDELIVLYPRSGWPLVNSDDDPLVTQDETGDTVFEWWFQGRKLTMYADRNPILCFKVWEYVVGRGDGIDEVTLDTIDDFGPLWDWLHYKL